MMPVCYTDRKETGSQPVIIPDRIPLKGGNKSAKLLITIETLSADFPGHDKGPYRSWILASSYVACWPFSMASEHIHLIRLDSSLLLGPVRTDGGQGLLVRCLATCHGHPRVRLYLIGCRPAAGIVPLPQIPEPHPLLDLTQPDYECVKSVRWSAATDRRNPPPLGDGTR